MSRARHLGLQADVADLLAGLHGLPPTAATLVADRVVHIAVLQGLLPEVSAGQTFTMPGAPEAGRFKLLDEHKTPDGTEWVWGVTTDPDLTARAPETFLRAAIEMDT